MHVFYSFPDVVGKPGIGVAAQHNVQALIAEGTDVTLVCTSVDPGVELTGVQDVKTTLTLFGRRVPHRALGIERAYRYHDWRAARLLEDTTGIDVVHTWSRAVLKTAAVAHARDIAVVREVSNTHTAHAYEVVAAEHARLGVAVPKGHSHAYDARSLAREEAEYRAVDLLLVPSPFVRQTFVDRGFGEDQLAPHAYGFDPSEFYPDPNRLEHEGPLTVLFAARGEPRKGLHILLEAWESSGLPTTGAKLLVLGDFIPGYREVLAHRLDRPEIEMRGFVADLAGVMRQSDVFVLPSVEEGSALVTYAAQASGAAVLVSDAAGARCVNLVDGLVHHVGAVEELSAHLRLVDTDRALLARLRRAGIETARNLTWGAAAKNLIRNYERAVRLRGLD